MIPLYKAQTEWLEPTEFPDLKEAKEIAIDLETKDINLTTRGSGSATNRHCGRSRRMERLLSYCP